MPTVDLNQHRDKLFNPLFFKLRKAKTRFVLPYGGAGSGKSYSEQQLDLLDLLDPEKEFDILYIRKSATTIYDSCFKLFKDIAEKWQLTEAFVWNYGNLKREIINKSNGRRIIFKGLDDPEKIKSIAGIRKVVIEEASELKKDDFLELNRRVRGVEGIQIILLFNPIDEKHWLKSFFFDTPEIREKSTIIKTTYLDNKFLTKEDHEQLELLKITNPNHYKIYALGEWGKFEVDLPYCYNFDPQYHISKTAVLQNWAVPVFSFDFNVDNCFCTLWQSGKDYIYGIDEIIGKDIYDVLNKLKMRYRKIVPLCMVTGDRSGENRHHALRDDINTYKIIMRELGINQKQLRIFNNPPHKKNRQLCNTVLAVHPNIKLNPKMVDTIYDLQYVEADKDGGIIKKSRDVANQKADGLDTFRYYINAFHSDIVQKYVN